MAQEEIVDISQDLTALSQTEPVILAGVGGYDLARTYFTFRNTGPTAAYSITVDTIRVEGQSMDFEPIAELRAGTSVTCHSIVHPVVGNDPHWTFDFWAASGEPFAVPFIVRYEDTDGSRMITRGTLEFDGRNISLVSGSPAQMTARQGA